MSIRRLRTKLALSLLALSITVGAQAMIPVVDIGAITQLVTQIRALQDQLTTLRDHLAQARSAYQAITGRRGMENLLAGTVRNYLPADWQSMIAVMQNASAQYQQLSAALRQTMAQNAYLTPAQVAQLTPVARAQLEAQRRSVATLQTVAAQALSNTSARFAALQALINAIPGAADEKAVLDLQARIQAEQGMLANEHTKVGLLLQAVEAEDLARQQRDRERAIADIGSLRALPAMGL